MANHKRLLMNIERLPDGPQVAAIFDFDGTLIAGYSATVFIKEQLRRGDLTTRDFLELMGAATSFGMGNLGFSALLLVTAQFMRGMSEKSYIEFGEELYTNHIARLIYPESRALVEAHQAKGHTVAVISSATPYQVEPAARDLGIKHIMCSYLEVENGDFTGGVVRPTCFGQGKVDAAEALSRQEGVDLDQSVFYSDSDDDIELLERVAYPVVLNPNKKLGKIAKQRNWPLARFGSRGRPSVAEYVRSIAATGSLVTSFVAGLPVMALTGSRRDAQNFSFSLFADSASALIGLTLNVKNEQYLWSHRPAIFVFNHQSKADVIIIARLLRRDIAGIGKKEIKSMPIIGKVMELGGVVFVDRADTKNAIEAISPLVDAMKNDGKSVVLAPEGTRSVSPTLAPFKKGAFHLAMQAGVPMVPIVIRNAGDVAPKGDFVFRSANVDVEVLPPIDTSDWTPETIGQHVHDVREMFQQALGQDLDEDATVVKKAAEKRSSKVVKKASAAKRTVRKKKISVKEKGAKNTSVKKPVSKRAAAKTSSAKKTSTGKSTSKKTAANKRTTKKNVAVKNKVAVRKTVTAKKAATKKPKKTSS